MKILLFGASGQVGRETLSAAAREGLEIVAFTSAEVNLTTIGAGAEAIARVKPQAVINAAAWTAVDKAETEHATAFRLNAAAPHELAAACARTGARLIHLSTDYVFDGAGSAPLDETAPTAPLNAYGSTKLEGERRVSEADPSAVIIRTSWVFASHGANFLRTMLRLSETRNELSVVNDQIGGPTPASSIAAACLTILRQSKGPGGLYHFQGAPPASWADFAIAIFAAAGRDVMINKVMTRDYASPTQRPLYTVLNCSKILHHYGIQQPEWRSDLGITVSRLQNS